MTIPCPYCDRQTCVGMNPHNLVSVTCGVCWEEGHPNIVVRRLEASEA